MEGRRCARDPSRPRLRRPRGGAEGLLHGPAESEPLRGRRRRYDLRQAADRAARRDGARGRQGLHLDPPAGRDRVDDAPRALRIVAWPARGLEVLRSELARPQERVLLPRRQPPRLVRLACVGIRTEERTRRPRDLHLLAPSPDLVSRGRLLSRSAQTRSITAAMAWPKPMHIVASP